MKGIISRGVIMIGNDWDEHLKNEYEQPYFQELLNRYPYDYDLLDAYFTCLFLHYCCMLLEIQLIKIQKW